MSHTVKIDTKFLDEQAAIAAANEMGAEIVRGKLHLYQKDSTVENGFGVKLPGWRYPVIIDFQTGEAQYDDFKGRWGDTVHLEKFKQLYATHKATIEFKKKGWLVSRTLAPNGSIKLQVTGVA